MPALLQRRHQSHHVIALHLNAAVFHSATRSAGRFELLGQRRQSHSIQPQAPHHRHALATPPLRLPLHPHNAIRRRATHSCQSALVGRAPALRHGLAAIGADAAGFGGVDQCGGGLGFQNRKEIPVRMLGLGCRRLRACINKNYFLATSQIVCLQKPTYFIQLTLTEVENHFYRFMRSSRGVRIYFGLRD
jgi:hypothetical protein